MSCRATAAVVTLSALNALGCGSSADPKTSGAPCELNMPVQGALSTTLTGSGCGSGSGTGGTSLSWFEITQGGASTTVRLRLTTELKGGVTGSLPLESVSITSKPSKDAESKDWETPKGACTATITSNESKPDPTFENQYVVKGNGSCSAPAAPEKEAGADGPVIIGAFTFTGFINPTK